MKQQKPREERIAEERARLANLRRRRRIKKTLDAAEKEEMRLKRRLRGKRRGDGTVPQIVRADTMARWRREERRPRNTVVVMG